MATVLEECTTEEQRSVVRFLLAKLLNVEDIHTGFCYDFSVGKISK
jgi:hypothetical protein